MSSFITKSNRWVGRHYIGETGLTPRVGLSILSVGGVKIVGVTCFSNSGCLDPKKFEIL